MPTHIIEITGLSDETLRRLDQLACTQGTDRSDFVCKLIERDLAQQDARLKGASFDEAPDGIRQAFAEGGLSEEQSLALLTEGLKATRAVRRARRAAVVGRRVSVDLV